MTVKSGGQWSGLVVTKDATGALVAPSVGPVGVLYVNGTANGAGVTITGANPYKWTVTLPALVTGDCVSLYITATVATIATASVVAEDVCDALTGATLAVGAITAAVIATGAIDADAIAADAIGSSELAATAAAKIAAAVWTYATRTLTSLGTLLASVGAAVWAYATRTLTSASTAPGTGLTASTWTVLRGDSLSRTFTTIAADAGITKAQLSVKRSTKAADVDAILAISSAGGLLRLNGAAPSPGYTATLTLPAGVLTIPAQVMAELESVKTHYDVQVWRGTLVDTIELGRFVVTDDVTRTVTPA